MKDSNIFDVKVQKISDSNELEGGDKIVSYSQFSMYDTCPKQWELTYIKKYKHSTPNIHTIFGSAIHTVIQEWLKVLYTKSVKKSNELDLSARLKEELTLEYQKEYKKSKVHFSTPQELYEFWEDGSEILAYLKKKRIKYFSTRRVEFVGYEIPMLLIPDKNKPKVKFQAYIDLVFKDLDTNIYDIIDIKTSKNGWKEWDKKNTTKISQVILYKIFFSELYNVPVDNIKVTYFILKRKIILNSEFPQSKIQTFSPSQGSITMKKTKEKFLEFVKNSFQNDGSYNEERKYPAYAGKDAKNCFFCPFKDNFELCPKENRITDV